MEKRQSDGRDVPSKKATDATKQKNGRYVKNGSTKKIKREAR